MENGVDLARVIKQCEDHLFRAKSFSAQERVLYYHLLRHSRIEGQEQILVALLPLANALALSETTVRECIRALHERGCIQIVDRSRQGHLVRISLPEELEGVLPVPASDVPFQLEDLDFFTGRRFIAAIIAREQGKCFFCFKSIRTETCELDHVSARTNGTDNSYRNIVASCHECNTTKQATPAADFVRSLYRKDVLTQAELSDRLAALERLQSGQLLPDLDLVRAAI